MISTKQTEEILLTRGSVGTSGKPPSQLQAFGTSMLPFLRANQLLHLEPIDPFQIRRGDLLTVRTQQNSLISHRVVKILPVGDQITFLLKGDNRLRFDALVLPDQILGKVVRAGKRDLTRWGWRWLSLGIAWVSYRQTLAYHALVCLNHNQLQRLNAFRYRLVQKGWFPRLNVRKIYYALSNPLGSFIESYGLSWIRLFFLRSWLALRGIQIRTWKPEDASSMVSVWNQVFSRWRTTQERLEGRILQSAWFDPKGCWLVFRSGRCLGWGMTSCRFPKDKPLQVQEGFLEILAVTQEGYSAGADRLLLDSALLWLKRRGVTTVTSNFNPASGVGLGIQASPSILKLSDYGFAPRMVRHTLRLTPGTLKASSSQNGNRKLHIRGWQEEDDSQIKQLLIQCRWSWSRIQPSYHKFIARGGDPDQVVVATLEGHLVGFARWLRDDQVRDYRDLHEVFPVMDVAKPTAQVGHVFQVLIAPSFRGRGIGRALMAHLNQAQFSQGVKEIRLWTAEPQFYERMGYQKDGIFLQMKREVAPLPD